MMLDRSAGWGFNSLHLLNAPGLKKMPVFPLKTEQWREEYFTPFTIRASMPKLFFEF